MLPQVIGRLIHINRIPVDDCGNDKIERHGAFLLCIWLPIMDARLIMGKNGLGQRVPCLTFIQASLTFLSEFLVFHPIQHE